MDEDICRKHVGEKPKDVVSCVGDCTGTGWVYGNWDEVKLFLFFFLTYLIDMNSVIMMVVVSVNVRQNAEMHQIFPYQPTIVYLILFSILNDVLKHLVINHDGILLHGLMYVLNILLLIIQSCSFFSSVIAH